MWLLYVQLLVGQNRYGIVWAAKINPARIVARKCLLGWLYVFAGRLGIENLLKSPLLYSISYFNLGGLGLCLHGRSPLKHPRGDGPESPWTANSWRSLKWSTYCKHRCAAALEHAQGCHIKNDTGNDRCIKKSAKSSKLKQDSFEMWFKINKRRHLFLNPCLSFSLDSLIWSKSRHYHSNWVYHFNYHITITLIGWITLITPHIWSIGP